MLDVGLALALVTITTNKPYLGAVRHPWDPMLLGVFLMGIAAAVLRWFAGATSGVRRGFTAQRLSEADKRRVGAIGMVSGFLYQTQSPESPSHDFHGGHSGGGGASSTY